jgi:hypothetical protein
MSKRVLSTIDTNRPSKKQKNEDVIELVDSDEDVVMVSA